MKFTLDDMIVARKRDAKKMMQARKQKDWDSFFMLIEGHHYQDAFTDVYEEMSPQDYWKYLRNVITGQCLYNDELKNLLINKSKDLSLRHLMMQQAERRKLDELPNIFSIYRGAEANSPGQGWSWTLSKRVASYFAKRFKTAVVIEGRCVKEDVIAYFNHRKEQEIVIPYDKVKNIMVLEKLINKKVTNTDNVYYKNALEKQLGIPSLYAIYKQYDKPATHGNREN